MQVDIEYEEIFKSICRNIGFDTYSGFFLWL